MHVFQTRKHFSHFPPPLFGDTSQASAVLHKDCFSQCTQIGWVYQQYVPQAEKKVSIIKSYGYTQDIYCLYLHFKDPFHFPVPKRFFPILPSPITNFSMEDQRELTFFTPKIFYASWNWNFWLKECMSPMPTQGQKCDCKKNIAKVITGS